MIERMNRKNMNMTQSISQVCIGAPIITIIAHTDTKTADLTWCTSPRRGHAGGSVSQAEPPFYIHISV